MDWGKVVYVFFALMSLTSIAGFLYEHGSTVLFVAASLNLVSTFLKIGIRNFSFIDSCRFTSYSGIYLFGNSWKFRMGYSFDYRCFNSKFIFYRSYLYREFKNT